MKTALIFLPVLVLGFILEACTSAIEVTPGSSAEVSSRVTTPPPLLISTSPPETATPLPSQTSSPTLQDSPTPTDTLTPTPMRCWVEGGHMEFDQLNTDLLRQPLEFRIYLPPFYDQQPDRRYPVLYLIHGQSYNDDQWDRLGADESADDLILAHEVDPFIIVMPRDRVWTQPKDDMFGQAIINLLIPWVDEHFRTLPDRDHRAIGGLSRGAAWAVHLGITNWELFGAIGAHSLPIFASDTPFMRKWLEDIPPASMPRIYLDIADKDRWKQIATWFENLLTEDDIPHVWHLYPGYHEEAYWQAHVEEYLRWYAQGW